MPREKFSDLLSFIAVARERSFTRAAAQIGVSPSALSHAVQALESRLGVRLLTRTTRKVSATEAGERLLATIAPRFEEIESELEVLKEQQGQPAGTIRIATSDYAAKTVLWPKLWKILPLYPDLKIETIIDNGLSDIVADRCDLGVRLRDQVALDMIAARIAPDLRMIVVGSPSYFANRQRPDSPQDLANHDCINLLLSTFGGNYAWEFQDGDQELKVRVKGQLTFNSILAILDAAIAGLGLAFMPEDLAQEHVDTGRLIRVLGEWSPIWPGLHLYYTSRRQSSRALTLVIETLRYRL
jgi:DNA-binding transcriptional LysR family regulator